MDFLGLPKTFIIATVIYVITRIARAIGKDNDDSLPIIILGFIAACIMAYTGIIFLLDLV